VRSHRRAHLLSRPPGGKLPASAERRP
jgi:hypothetical protein